MQRRLVRAVILELDAHQHLGRRGLRVRDVDRPVAVVVEHTRVEQLELRVLEAAPVVDELLVGKRRLRIVVAPAQQRVTREALEIPPVLLDVLAVIALWACEAEHALLQDRVVAVPQREGETELVADVGEAGHSVLVPAVRARASVVVRERRPRIAALRVVLAHGAPRPLAQIRPPLVPRVRGEQIVLGAARRLGEACVLRGHASPRGARSKRCQPHGSSET